MMREKQGIEIPDGDQLWARLLRTGLVLALLPLLSSCIIGSVAGAAVDVVTLPVDVAAKGVDLATTSQSEADEKRGREVREAEERAGREARLMAERCRRGEQRPGDDCTALPR